jgi:energy coupling factor transporter S component ThiW
MLAAMFAALATLLGSLSIPVGPLKVAPLQHTINAIAGIWLGPWYAAGAALVTAFLRHALGWGSLFAFPGSPFGALVVGYAYRFLRSDAAALCEPIGTGPIGATIAAWFFQPLVGSHHTLWWFQVAFLSSSIPGAILGYAVVRVLRRVPTLAAWAAQP